MAEDRPPRPPERVHTAPPAGPISETFYPGGRRRREDQTVIRFAKLYAVIILTSLYSLLMQELLALQPDLPRASYHSNLSLFLVKLDR